jgi:hypothetical protein
LNSKAEGRMKNLRLLIYDLRLARINKTPVNRKSKIANAAALQNRHGVMEIMTNTDDLSIPFVFNGFRDYRRNTFPTGDKRPSGAKPERFQTVLAVKHRQTV